MFAEYFDHAGPVMYAVLATWIVVLAGVLDRLLYALGGAVRRPWRRLAALAAEGRLEDARLGLAEERWRAGLGLARIDAVSQLATSVGLFGTVLGLARAFFARGSGLGLESPQVLASGLATALFTTIGGLIVFLFGQGFLILFREWLAYCERDVDRLADLEAAA